MKKTFTKQYMLDNCGCYGHNRTEQLFFSDGNDGITIGIILNASIPIRDKYWFVFKKTGLKRKQNQKIAIALAEMVLPIYERRYPDNKAPREAIEAAKQFIGGHISIDVLIEKRNTAYTAAATAAADTAYTAAAYTAAAAAAVAYTAYTAAYTADAADAADAAYTAAAAAADAAATKKQIEQYLIDFVSNEPETE